MNVQLTQIDLGKFGNLSTYEFSGERGEIVHEFAPLTESSNSVAIIVAEGASLRQALTLERGPGLTPVTVERDNSGLRTKYSPASVVAIPLDQNGMLASYQGRPPGSAGVAVEV